MKAKLLLIKQITLHLCLLCTLWSCTKENLEQPEETDIIPKKFDQILNNLSLNKNEVHYINSLDVIAHGDILYHADTNTSINTTKEHWANLAVFHKNTKNISYKIIGLGANNLSHNTIIDQALQEWEDISPNIGFTKVTNVTTETDLTITLQNTSTFNQLNPNFIGSGAFATFPKNQKPGTDIFIREVELRRNNLALPIKILLVVHEVGHILGFTHPNQEYRGGINIPCAGTVEWHSNNRCGSIMNSITNSCNWPNNATTIQQFRDGADGWTLSDRYIIDWAYELTGDNDPICN